MSCQWRVHFHPVREKTFLMPCVVTAREAGECSYGEFPDRCPWWSWPLQMACRGAAECPRASLRRADFTCPCMSEIDLWRWRTRLSVFSSSLCLRWISIFKLRVRPAWKFLSGFLCRICLMYVYFISMTQFMRIPVIINKGLSVENHDESGFLNGCISCRVGKTTMVLNWVKTLCHQFVFSQPYMERKGCLVNHVKKRRQGVEWATEIAWMLFGQRFKILYNNRASLTFSILCVRKTRLSTHNWWIRANINLLGLPKR